MSESNSDIELVLSDFDGTLTLEIDLTPLFFDILSLLKNKGIPLVIVTGRSKSWAHFLLTHFSYLDHVISEGGGVISSIDKQGMISDHLTVSQRELERLEKFVELLRRQVPDAHFSADSFGRQTDRALEIDYINANQERASDIKNMMRKNGINFSASSVHLNFWCGEVSKYKAVELFLRDYLKVPQKNCVYFGDALNDQSVFEHMPRTVGVSNIRGALDRFSHRPNIVLEGEDGRGPSGVYNYLLSELK